VLSTPPGAYGGGGVEVVARQHLDHLTLELNMGGTLGNGTPLVVGFVVPEALGRAVAGRDDSHIRGHHKPSRRVARC